jgi:monofunctional biosynthetic peptidoglycan transglycosylase
MRVSRPFRRLFFLSLAALSFGIAIFTVTLPDARELASGWPERTAYMRDWLDDQEEGATIDYRPVPLSQIPQRVRRAVLVSEDAAFYEHGGFDWHEIRAAIREAWAERRAPRGASTITQQLARNIYLSASRNPFRKLREALVTRRLERALSKDRILELYLNVIEFGPGVYGVDAAARRYFGTSIGNVSQRQAAELAGTIPSPRRNNPATRTGSFQFRTRLAYARAFGAANPDTVAPPAGVPDAPIAIDPPADPGDDTAEVVPDTATAPADTLAAPADTPADTLAAPPDTSAAPVDTLRRGDTPLALRDPAKRALVSRT